jgi:DNA polymerase
VASIQEPELYLYIDIETRSRVDLKKSPVYRYTQCPDFRILMASWSIDGGSTVHSALTPEAIDTIPGLWDPTVTKVAHNAAFERVCFSRFAGLAPGAYLPVEEWEDTMSIAAELGFPKKLEHLAVALGAEEKDSAGTRLINLFCRPNRKGGWNGPDTHPLDWMDFIAYCDQDVSTLADVHRRLLEYGGWPTELERAVYEADQRINDRGIAIDVSMARHAVAAGAKNEIAQVARVTELTGVENPNSVQQMGRWLSEQGLRLPDLRAETVEKVLATDLTPTVREVLELRQELALAAPAKFATALGSQVNGRLHGTLSFFGAHTGRWAGRGTQVQNLPRAAFKLEVDQEMAILELLNDEDVSAEDLKRLVRALFIGPFTVVDYSAIEARVIAWLAGEGWALQAFRDGRDIYVETAQRMGGLSRAEGKVAVLALGYNGGPNSLRHMAGEGTIGGYTDEELYDQFVYPWREANPRIVLLWKQLETAFRTGGPAGPRLQFEKVGNDRLLRLPSGRAIAYRKCGVSRTMDPRTHKARERLTFASPQGFRADTYGGRLAENATQAVARDILAEALVRLEKAGYRVVAHVHDEILVEGEHDVAEIAKIMTERPSWAPDMPIDGEGFTCQRYRKG